MPSDLKNKAKSGLLATERDMKAEREKLAQKGADNKAKLKEQAEKSAQRAKAGVEQGAEEVKKSAETAATKARDVAKSVEKGTDDLVKKAEAALSSSPKPQSAPSGPRQLDATPQAPVKADLPAYQGQIPLGFEAPPGFAGSAPRPRVPTTEKPGDSKAVRPAPPPLPLVAPNVRDLSASEPVLGQLAATIDSLASFLRDVPQAASKSSGDAGSAKDVLTTAELDLKNLGKRLEGIKAEERAALEKKLNEQAKEYSGLLLEAERELHTRLDKQESDWKNAFDNERSNLVKAYKSKLEAELETQQDIINERLKEEVVKQGIEMQRRWVREIKLRVEQERGGRLAKLEELEGGLKKLERLTLDNDEYLDENLRVHRLWSAIRAVNAVSQREGRPPLTEEIRALQSAARKPAPPAAGDEGAPLAKPGVIDTALSSIPTTALADGIESDGTLRNWFADRVAPRIKAASLLPQDAGVLSYFASWTLSSLLFTKQGFVEGNDVPSVLSRVDVYLQKRDIASAARELNQLKGWPKVLARDWLEAARRHLEVKQALEVSLPSDCSAHQGLLTVFAAGRNGGSLGVPPSVDPLIRRVRAEEKSRLEAK